MESRVSQALCALRDLGTPAELRALAESNGAASSPLPTNAHIHLPPNFSAFETVTQAIDLAREQKIGVLGVSNYYDYQVYGDFVQQAQQHGIFPLFGLEIISMQDELRSAGVKVNDPGNPGKTYLCGKAITQFDEMTEPGTQLLKRIRESDQRRMRSMIDRMNAAFAAGGVDTGLDEAAVIDMVVRRHGAPRETVYLQERHLSQAFQEKLFELLDVADRVRALEAILNTELVNLKPEDSVSIQNQIRSHLMKAGKPAFVDEEFLSFAEARQLVLELGGIPCYPTLADGTSPICDFEADVDSLIDKLQSAQVYAAEWILPRNSIEVAEHYVPKMRAAGMVLTAGTEHNTLDLIPLPPVFGEGNLPSELETIFWEGACVCAAHQFLRLHGECGYVDSAGNLNPNYSTADQRIADLARIGSAVIARYRQLNS